MNSTLLVNTGLHPSKIDTLQSQLAHLTQTVDSLNKVTSVNTIGSGYFHDIIGGVIMIFILIVSVPVTIAGIISWRWITNRFDRMSNSFNQFEEQRRSDLVRQQENENKLKAYLDEKIKVLDNRHEGLQARANLLIFQLLKEEGKREESIVAALSAIESQIKIGSKLPAKNNIDLLLRVIKDSPLDHASVKQNFTQIKKRIDILRKTEGFELSDELNKIERLVSVVYFSEKQV